MEMKVNIIILVFFHCLYLLNHANAEFPEDNYDLKYEYKYSFKGPYLTQQNQIPFWGYYNDAVAGLDKVRLAPSLREKSGSVWSKYPFPHTKWQIEISFRVQGRGIMGADGLALWYIEKRNNPGSVFGSMDNWKGVGVLFDSFDNDNKKNNPYISVFVNDGSESYNHAEDGFNQIRYGCKLDFRNRPFPVKAKLAYADTRLELFIDIGNSPKPDFELCTTVTDVYLPRDYFFGVSAATGGLADDHDVLRFSTWSLQNKPENNTTLNETEEIAKFEEYEKSLKEFEEEHERFKEEHPDKIKEEYGRPEDLFQGHSNEEMTEIFNLQSDIKQYVSGLNHLVSTIDVKQNLLLKSFEEGPVHPDIAQSHQIKNSITLFQATERNINDFKTLIDSVKSEVRTLSTRLSSAPSGAASVEASIASKRFEAEQRILNIRESLHLIGEEITRIKEEQEVADSKRSCPKVLEVPCVSTGLFVGVAIVEIVLLILYFSCREPSVDPGKKYF